MSYGTPADGPVNTGGSGAAGIGSAGIYMGIGGALSSMVGSYYQAQAQKSAIEYQATVAQTNSMLAEKAAQSTLLQGQYNANRTQLMTASMLGTQRAGFAANGVDLGEGSAARVLTSTEMMGSLDAQMQTANAVRQAWGYRQQSTNYGNEALFSGSVASGMSPLAAGVGSLLTGASMVARNWYAQNKSGLGTGYGYGSIGMPDDAPTRGGR